MMAFAARYCRYQLDGLVIESLDIGTWMHSNWSWYSALWLAVVKYRMPSAKWLSNFKYWQKWCVWANYAVNIRAAMVMWVPFFCPSESFVFVPDMIWTVWYMKSHDCLKRITCLTFFFFLNFVLCGKSMVCKSGPIFVIKYWLKKK